MENVILYIAKKRRLRSFIKLYDGILLNGNLYGFHVADGDGDSDVLHKRQRPVVSIIGNAKHNLFRRDFCDGIVHHAPNHMQGSDGHIWSVFVSPLVSHEKYIVGDCAQCGRSPQDCEK